MNKNEGKSEPEVREPQKVEREVASLSSNVLNMLAIGGEVTEPGPQASPCKTGNSVSAYWVRHPWSVYGVDEKVLREGMENLERKLPENGWRIEKTGEDSSKNKNREILAVHLKTRSQVEVTLLKGSNRNEPLIEVSLYSQCFEKPQR